VSNSLNSKTATVTANFTAATGGLVAAKGSPSSVNSVIGGSQNITITAQDSYGNPLANQTIYIGSGAGTSLAGLWITQVNGVAITSSVNMGTTSSTSMQTVSTPIPLYVAATLPAYDSAAVTGVTAYNLKTAPIVALTTGVDGTVSITLVDGNVTYVANTATPTVTNSYAVDGGTPVANQTLGFYSDNALNTKLGGVQVNWTGTGGGGSNVVHVTGVTLNNPTLALTVGGTSTLVPTVAPTTATTQTVTWTSSNTAIATVSASGVVTAVSAGQATITATTTDGAKTATSTVTVTAAQTSDIVTGTYAVTPTNFGSWVTVTVTNPVNLKNATQFQVYLNGAADSNVFTLGTAATALGTLAKNTVVQVKLLDATGAQVGAIQNVTLQ